MINHTGLLMFLTQRYKLSSYLEIGVYHPSINFDKIPCRNKIGVDPAPSAKASLCMTSDEFFQQNENTFDLVLIDGLHTKEQVKKDFENALRCLNYGGFIVLHDCNPEAEKYTHVPRDNKIWCGDVYKFACTLREYKDINFVTVNFDHGCAVCWLDEREPQKPLEEELTWSIFSSNRKELLNLIQPNEITNYLPDAASYRKEYRAV